MAVLKFYKVDGDGKIERLRRECPTPEVCIELIEGIRLGPFLFFFARNWGWDFLADDSLKSSVALGCSWLPCTIDNIAESAILLMSSILERAGETLAGY